MSNNNNTRRGGGILTINAWNTETIEGESTNSFECEANRELHRYFLLQEPIAVLLLIDKQAKWNQELENVYLISCEHIENNCQHYEYELRPDNDCLWHTASKCLSYLYFSHDYFWRHKSYLTRDLNCSLIYPLLIYTIALCISAAFIVDVVIVTPKCYCTSTTFLLCRFFFSETLTAV